MALSEFEKTQIREIIREELIALKNTSNSNDFLKGLLHQVREMLKEESREKTSECFPIPIKLGEDQQYLIICADKNTFFTNKDEFEKYYRWRKESYICIEELENMSDLDMDLYDDGWTAIDVRRTK